MSFKQFMAIPVFIAVQAMALMLLAPYIPGATEAVGGPGLLTWIAFQAWAMYFLCGCTIPMAGKVVAGYVGGILASIAIFEIGDALAGGMGGYWGYALAVLIVVVPVISMERVPGLNFIPSYFIGAGVFFGIMSLTGIDHDAKGYMSVATPEMVGCVAGLVFGWVTVTFRGWYEAKIGTAKADATAPESEPTA